MGIPTTHSSSGFKNVQPSRGKNPTGPSYCTRFKPQYVSTEKKENS